MPSIKELVDRGALVPLGGNLGPREQKKRLMYAVPSVIVWFQKVLPNLVSDGYIEGASTPQQQAATQVKLFIIGDDPDEWMVPHLMRPRSSAIWELRTPDLRFFGWFYRRGIFVLGAMASTKDCKDTPGTYKMHHDECLKIRDELDLDDPKYTVGELPDVF